MCVLVSRRSHAALQQTLLPLSRRSQLLGHSLLQGLHGTPQGRGPEGPTAAATATAGGHRALGREQLPGDQRTATVLWGIMYV